MVFREYHPVFIPSILPYEWNKYDVHEKNKNKKHWNFCLLHIFQMSCTY